ncbi:MAG: translation initiation factor IF-2 subunit beta [Methanomassiliicoccales archaeon PtaU1.Bin124]|nr:MAG: translation initiation factor IF-2 subunit beta [Methanomassiliicoccales archaeon PtaU1.Bin124]
MRDEYGFKGKKPVEVGNIYDIAITDLGAQGDGVGTVNGFVVIVQDGVKGKKYKVKITKVGPKMAFGKIVE